MLYVGTSRRSERSTPSDTPSPDPMPLSEHTLRCHISPRLRPKCEVLYVRGQLLGTHDLGPSGPRLRLRAAVITRSGRSTCHPQFFISFLPAPHRFANDTASFHFAETKSCAHCDISQVSVPTTDMHSQYRQQKSSWLCAIVSMKRGNAKPHVSRRQEFRCAWEKNQPTLRCPPHVHLLRAPPRINFPMTLQSCTTVQRPLECDNPASW